MGKEALKFLKSHWDFDLYGIIAVGLFIASFLVPPTGEIDSSVLAAGGILFSFAALRVVLKALDRGVDAKVTHGETSLTLGNPDQ